MLMTQNKPGESKRNNPPDLSKAIPEFDDAMRKIVATPKSEVERREQAEKKAKESSK